jgi:hypothetical protein
VNPAAPNKAREEKASDDHERKPGPRDRAGNPGLQRRRCANDEVAIRAAQTRRERRHNRLLISAHVDEQRNRDRRILQQRLVELRVGRPADAGIPDVRDDADDFHHLLVRLVHQALADRRFARPQPRRQRLVDDRDSTFPRRVRIRQRLLARDVLGREQASAHERNAEHVNVVGGHDGVRG